MLNADEETGVFPTKTKKDSLLKKEIYRKAQVGAEIKQLIHIRERQLPSRRVLMSDG